MINEEQTRGELIGSNWRHVRAEHFIQYLNDKPEDCSRLNYTHLIIYDLN